MKTRLACILILIVAITTIVSTFPVNAQEEDKTIRIAMVNHSLCCAYFVGMSQAVQDEAAFYANIEVIVTDSDGDPAKMIEDVKGVLTQDVDGIIISASFMKDDPTILNLIKEAGIPVVLVDRRLESGEYTSWIGPDDFTIGKQNGGYIVKRLNNKGRLAILKGGPADNPIGLARTNGVLSVVQQQPEIEVVTPSEFGGWSEDGGEKLMNELLAKYDKIDAVFCENDSMCLGAQRAIEAAGRSDEMFLAGVDGQKEALLQILNKTNYVATGLNNSDQIGRAAFHRMIAILAGADAPTETILPSPLITNDNAIKFYDPQNVF